ncbi:MAG: restriction endonuclease subunit S [Sideroxyarcus sp.]|nr:restriction endonuclease subunit S [Sideroxyarcus sp.]
MSFPRYPSYKDSGVEWLGAVPEHWMVKPLKRACNVFPSNVDKKSHEGETPVLLCNYTDVYYNESITAGMDFMVATASSDQIAKFQLRAGDTIITKDSETADDIAIGAYVPANLPGVVCGYHLSMVRPMLDTDGAFVKRLFDSTYAKSCFAVRANGLTRVGLGQYEIDNVELPFPPLPEQTQIAAFLDRETAKIDELVAEQRRLMELLKEKRQAVISHAVTQGLNPNAPMKPSGIEWLGDVPAHWEVSPLKYVATHNDEVLDEITAPDTEIVYVDISSVDGVNGIKTKEAIRFSDAPSRARRRVRHGDVIVSTVRTYLKAIARIRDPEENLIVSTGFAVIRPRGELTPDFLGYLLFASYFIEQVIARSTGVSYPAINASELVAIPVTVPPPDEQTQIAAFLDSELAKFDTLTAEAQRAIDLLQERRTALISAAVTGQIDVRPH